MYLFVHVSDYLFISVNPDTIHQHNFIHLEGKHLVKWKLCGWFLEDLHSKQLYSDTFHLQVWTFFLQFLYSIARE